VHYERHPMALPSPGLQLAILSGVVVSSAAAARTAEAQPGHFSTWRQPAFEAAAALIRAMQPACGTGQRGAQHQLVLWAFCVGDFLFSRMSLHPCCKHLV
jgi:hypothetical protein